MKTFEEQIKASAQRLRSRDNYRLPVRPLSRRRPYWGWVVSPAAAVAGLVLGWMLPRQPQLSSGGMAAVALHDTVAKAVEEHRPDTFLHEGSQGSVRASVAEKRVERKEKVVHSSGRNVECDGVDYALLVSF